MDILDETMEKELLYSSDVDYHALNAQLNLLGEDGKLQLDADKESVRQFFLQHVNQNTVFFHDLEEKIRYLIDNEYYEPQLFELYKWDFVKSLFKRAYAYKYRFTTFLGAFKYYSSYTLKTFDGKRYLERFEDRVTVTALYLADGDTALAEHILDEVMSGRLQPATPTFLNAGKKQRGELVSCFPAGTPIDTSEGQVNIENLNVGDMVLSHDGKYHAVTEVLINDNSESLVSVRHYGHKNPILCTPNHPILVWTDREVESLTEGDGADPENGFVWLEAQDVQDGDYVVATSPADTRDKSIIDLFKFVSDDKSLVAHEGRIKKLNLDKKLRNTTPYSRSFIEVNQFVEEDYNLGLILGWYLSEGYVSKRKNSDGSVTPNGIHFTLGAHEKLFQQELIEALREVFGVEAKLRVTTYDGSAKISVHSRALGELFLNLAGTGFNTKSLGHDILTANHEFQYGIIHGLFRGDGCTTNGAMILDLVNPEMIDAIQLILTRLGVISRVRTYLNMSGNLTGQLTIPGIAGENEELILNIGKNLQNYTGLKGCGKNLKNSRFYKTVNGRVVFMVANVALTDDSPQKVYNLEVDETHTYSVRGTVVHNCFLVRTEDDMESIARSITSSLQLSKRGGGVALNLTNLRGEGDPIKKIEGQSSGVVPVMKMLEDAFSYANQLGSRQGAGAVYLNVHHPDILKFLDTKRENADEKIRIKTLSLGVVIPDITFHLAKNNEDMYLFSPYDVERVYGKPFSDVSVSELYYDMVDNPDIRKKKINARQLFMTLAEIQFESGYPYILFEDTANRANPIEGRINMSNLCVTGDTRILTDMGYKKIGDVYESNADFRVVADNRAKKMRGNAKGVSVVDSSRVFRTAQNAEVFEVTTLTGYKIRATEWHKFYVIRSNDKVEKIRLNELREGDTLLIQGDAGVYGNIHKPTEAYIAGGLSVRGAFTDGKVWMSSRFEDMDEFINFFQGSVDAVTGDESTLHDVLDRLGIHEETYAQVPEFVFAGDKETQESFVSGVLDAVGDVHGSEITVVGDKDLLVDVQKVLLNLGVFARVFYDRLVATGVDAASWTGMSRVHDTITGENLKKLPRVARVKIIRSVGREDVYDVTVDDGHSLIFNGIATGNCSEILQINTPSTYHPDGSYDTVGKDISCNLASLNIAKAFDSPDFSKTVETAVRALTTVSDKSNIESVPSIAKGNNASHAIGLGQMNLHGFLAREHMHYDSEEARDFANMYFYSVTFNAISASNKIAVERGESFEGFENSKYATGEYFDKYIDQQWVPKTERVKELLKKSTINIPTQSDWVALRDRVRTGGMYNAYLQAVPPTGSISYINHSTSSIHPIVGAIETRKEGKLGRVYYPVPYLSDETLPYYKDAYRIGPKAIIDMYAVATQHVDQGLSLTLFYPADATTRDLNKSYIYAFSKGIKTMYYIRVKQKALAGTEVEGSVAEYCESCQL